jgi:hypothetical protein
MPSIKGIIGGRAGTFPDADISTYESQTYTATDKIRFQNGRPKKIGGWAGKMVRGATPPAATPARTVFSSLIDGKPIYMIGTSHRLYVVKDNSVINITPLKITTTAIANSLSTYYQTLASNPITTATGSNQILVAYTGGLVKAGDEVTISGATAVGGISAPTLNGIQYVVSATPSTMVISVATAATSPATGGGAAVVLARKTLLVTTPAPHLLTEGARVKLSGAVAAGGITAPTINLEFEIRNVTVNAFDVQTITTATSSVSAAGGASTVYYEEIGTGNVDVAIASGYGLGAYGTGAYGAGVSTTYVYPRIWSFDRYNSYIALTAGDQSPVYIWQNDTAVAPTIMPNSPAAVNLVSVDKQGIVNVYGSNGVENRQQNADAGDYTNWLVQAGYYPGFSTLQNAGRIISNAELDNGVELLFTNKACFKKQYVDQPKVYVFDDIEGTTGLIGPNARVVVGGVCYWMSENSFYMYAGGGRPDIMRSQGLEFPSIQRYVFDNINKLQAYKSFAWYNDAYREIWFHYPQADSMECNAYAIYSIDEQHWTLGTMLRSAGEFPNRIGDYPLLIESPTNTIMEHEKGVDANGAPLAFSAETSYMCFNDMEDTVILRRFMPDSNQVGDITVQVDRTYWMQNKVPISTTYTVKNDTIKIDTDVKCRNWRYKISGSALGQSFFMGKWTQLLDKSGGR